jgi:hypothetical protein
MAGNTQPRSKVARLIEQYGLAGVGDELEDRWTRSENRSSLRDLAAYFNRELLRATLEATGRAPLDGEIDNLYRLLTDDDVTSGAHQQARSRLDRRGVDVDSLEAAFVSYQSIRTYLRSHRDASPPTTDASPESRRESKRTTVQQLASRLDTVATEALRELRDADSLALGRFDVTVSVRVHCRDCHTRLPVGELLSAGGCQCATSPGAERPE